MRVSGSPCFVLSISCAVKSLRLGDSTLKLTDYKQTKRGVHKATGKAPTVSKVERRTGIGASGQQNSKQDYTHTAPKVVCTRGQP